MTRILLVVSLLLSAGCATKSLHQSDWVEITTPHFQVISSLHEEATTRLAGDLERVRYATEFFLGERMRPASKQTRVYAFDDRTLARPFDLRGQPGYFLPTLQGGIIVLRTGGGWREDSRSKLRHDYAHHLLRNHRGFSTSLWLDEGFAQFLSTIQIKDDSADLGITRRDHLIRLRNRLRLSLGRVLQMQSVEGISEQEREAFEAEAWALIHYLSFEVGDPAEAATRRRNYFKALGSGTPRQEAFRKAFGVDEDSFERGLFHYVREKRFNSAEINLEDSWKPKASDIRHLTRAEAVTELGWLSIALQKPQQARRYFKMALAKAPESHLAQAGLAAAARLENNPQEARAQAQVALEIAPDDALAHLELARAYHAEAESTGEFKERARLLDQARSHYRKSIAADPENPAPKALLGATYLVDNRDLNKADDSLASAHAQLPSSLEILLLRAQVAAAKGDWPKARYRARTVRARTHSKSQSKAAGQILEPVPSPSGAVAR